LPRRRRKLQRPADLYAKGSDDDLPKQCAQGRKRVRCVLRADCRCAIFIRAWAQSRDGLRESLNANPCQGGYVHSVSGLVSEQGAGAKASGAKAGDIFESDTIFRTGSDGKVILKFADGEIVALAPNSAVRIGRYCYLPDSLRQSSSTIELIMARCVS